MPGPYFLKNFLGKFCVVKYGSRVINADSIRITITTPLIDITNVSVYEPMEVRLPPRKIEPRGDNELITKDNFESYIAQYGQETQQLFGGRREYQATITGKAYNQSVMPIVGNFVRILMTDDSPTIEVPRYFSLYGIANEFTYENDVRGYLSWTLTVTGSYDNRLQLSDVLANTQTTN